ncbi:MAG: hypothetical protein P1P84_02795 [Deferrisomatales bacterium]|nr:hypothetical protein [Deferrisomatales bacterium]
MNAQKVPVWLKMPKGDVGFPEVVRAHRVQKMDSYPGKVTAILEKIRDTPKDAAIMTRWLKHWRGLGVPHVVVKHHGKHGGYFKVWKPCEEELWDSVEAEPIERLRPWAPPPFAAGVVGG